MRWVKVVRRRILKQLEPTGYKYSWSLSDVCIQVWPARRWMHLLIIIHDSEMKWPHWFTPFSDCDCTWVSSKFQVPTVTDWSSLQGISVKGLHIQYENPVLIHGLLMAPVCRRKRTNKEVAQDYKSNSNCCRGLNPLVTSRWVTIGTVLLNFISLPSREAYFSSETRVGEQTPEYSARSIVLVRACEAWNMNEKVRWFRADWR